MAILTSPPRSKGGFRASFLGMSTLMSDLASQVVEAGGTLRFATRVVRVSQPPEGGWDVTTTPNDTTRSNVVASSAPFPSFVGRMEETEGVETRHYEKLIVATGYFSTPSVPDCAVSFLLQPSENAPDRFAVHSLGMSRGDVRARMAEAEGRKRVVVVGASKSAWDIAVEMSKAGFSFFLFSEIGRY